jgi:hypothetical protein
MANAESQLREENFYQNSEGRKNIQRWEYKRTVVESNSAEMKK